MYVLEDVSLLGDWRKAIEEEKSRFLSLTLASKSGRRYDRLGKEVANLV